MTRFLAAISLLLTIVFVVAIIMLHILSPDINPMVSGISFYALGRFGLVLALGLASVGISGIALAVSLWPSRPSSLGRVGLILLVLWGLSSILAALFPLDAPGSPPTVSGRIHGLSGMNFLLIAPALLLVEPTPAKKASPVSLRPSTYWLAWGLVAAAILLFVFNGPFYSLQVGGIVQRLYWIVLVLWLILKASHTRSGANNVPT